jgi:hypothetical protein
VCVCVCVCVCLQCTKSMCAAQRTSISSSSTISSMSQARKNCGKSFRSDGPFRARPPVEARSHVDEQTSLESSFKAQIQQVEFADASGRLHQVPFFTTHNCSTRHFVLGNHQVPAVRAWNEQVIQAIWTFFSEPCPPVESGSVSASLFATVGTDHMLVQAHILERLPRRCWACIWPIRGALGACHQQSASQRWLRRGPPQLWCPDHSRFKRVNFHVPGKPRESPFDHQDQGGHSGCGRVLLVDRVP